MLARIVAGLRSFVYDRRRSLAKTAVYRLLSVALTVAVAYGILREPGTAVEVGLLANGAKMVVYFGHERLWASIDWGEPG
jgi:uncharacterized membrane protein